MTNSRCTEGSKSAMPHHEWSLIPNFGPQNIDTFLAFHLKRTKANLLEISKL